MAKLGVLVANAIPSTEAYWRGAVTLDPPDGTKTEWLSAVVWLRNDVVVRVLLNVSDATQARGTADLSLAAVYGAAGTTKGAVTVWQLPDGVTATLDIGVRRRRSSWSALRRR